MVVTVADGGKSWLEITVDGTQQVADVYNGPWTLTYTVTSEATVSIGNPDDVTVTRNGQPVTITTDSSGTASVDLKVESKTDATGSGSTSTSGSSDSSSSGSSGSSGSSSGSSSGDATKSTTNLQGN
jgi:hypothetical protein